MFIMLKQVPLVILFIMFFVSGRAFATTRYVDGNLRADCTAGDYSIASRSCTGSDGDAYITIADGLTNTASQDTLLIRAGTYDESIGSTDIANGGGSWATATTVQAYNSETVTLLPTSGNCTNSTLYVWRTGGINYVIVDGLTFDGTNCDGPIVTFRSGGSGPIAHHIRLINSEVLNSTNNCVYIWRATGFQEHDIEIIGNTIHDCGTDRFAHGIYIRTADNLVEGNTIWNISGHGVHVHKDGQTDVSNNIVRDNIIHDNGSWGILIGSGSDNQAYNNVVYDNGATQSAGGIRTGFNSTNNQIYNNTIVDNNSNCIHIGSNSTNAAVKDNICWGNSRDSIRDEGTGTFVEGNLFSDPVLLAKNEPLAPTNLRIVQQ